jgi:hypothetical protein
MRSARALSRSRRAHRKRLWPSLARSRPGHQEDHCNRNGLWRLVADDARTPLDATGTAAADGETSATAASGAPAAASSAAAAAASAAATGAASAAATAAATASAATAAATTAATAAAATPAAGRKPHAFAEMGCSTEFFIENIERAETDVGDFLLTEDGDGGQRGSFRRDIGCRGDCRRCAAGHRQRHSGSSPGRQGYFGTLSLRGSLRLRHFQVLPCFFRANTALGHKPNTQHATMLPGSCID